jgi:hypothetical protein
MGYVPIFIVTAGAMFLWGMTAYHTLRNRLAEVKFLAELLAQDPDEHTKEQYHYAVRMYNATVADGAAKFWAKLFGFKQQ